MVVIEQSLSTEDSEVGSTTAVRVKGLEGETENALTDLHEIVVSTDGEAIPKRSECFQRGILGRSVLSLPAAFVEGSEPGKLPESLHRPGPEFRNVTPDPDFIYDDAVGNWHIVQRYRKAGLAVIPIARHSLHGHLPGFGFKRTPPGLKWGHWKQRPIWDREAAQYWAGPRFHGIGVPCGAVSGGLEDTEFDCHETYLKFEKFVKEGKPDLWARLVIMVSPSNGRHLLYRCEEVSGNRKLAQRVVVDESGDPVLDKTGHPKVDTLIETRGEGGQFVAPGSPADVHPSGLPYVFEQGTPETIQTISTEERDYLHVLARSFNKFNRPEKPKKERSAGDDGDDEAYGDPDKPWDDFNRRADWEFVFDGTEYEIHPCGRKVSRPGKSVSEGSSASLDYLGLPMMHVFSSSMGGTFEHEGNYTKFATWAILKHGGDFSSAARAAIDLGYGKQGRERGEALEWGKRHEERVGRWEKLQQETIRESAKSVAKFKDNDLFSYLWKGHHRRLNDEDRYKRMCSTVRALKLVPAIGFFPEYFKSQLPCSDCPVIYHVASALVMAGHLLNRKVRMPFGNSTIYPNVWAGVLGPSSVFHKSHAVNSVKRVMPNVPGYEYSTLPDSFTFEAMISRLGWILKENDDETVRDVAYFGGSEQMADELPIQARKKMWCEQQEKFADEAGTEFTQGVGLFHLNEIGGWLATLGNNQNLSAKETLTHLYDCPTEWQKATVTNGIYYVYRPCLSILGASTVNWLQDNLSESDIQGGFMPRWLFFNAKAKDYIMSIPDEPDAVQQEVAFEAARRLAKMRGFVRLGDDEATEIYWSWRQRIEKQGDPMVLSWANRMGMYALKVAMIFEASVTEGDTVSTISPGSMRAAVTLIDYLLSDLRGILQDLAFDKNGQNLNKLKNYIKHAGKDGIGHSTALKKSKLDKNMFGNLVGTLAETGEVVVVPDGEPSANGKQPVKYVYVSA